MPHMPEPGSAELSRMSTLKIAGAAVFGDIRKREVTAVTNARLDALMAESTPQGPQEKGVKAWFSRTASNIWHEVWHGAYEQRDRLFALQAHEAADIPTDLADDIRRKAMDRAKSIVDADKNRKKKVGWQEWEGYFTEYHKEALSVMREWRAELGKLNDPSVPAAEKSRIIAENPLYGQRLAALAAQDEIATNIAQEATQPGILHRERGEMVIGDKLVISKDSQTGRDMLDHVIKPYLKSLAAGGDADAAWVAAQTEMSHVFQSNEFKQYLQTLPPEQRDMLISDQYATNLRSTLESMFQANCNAQDFVQSVDALNVDIEMTLGVAEMGPRHKIEATRTERMVKKNKELYELLRHRNVTGAFDQDKTNTALRREQMLWARASDTLQNEIVLGMATGAVLYLPRWGLSKLARVWSPVLGGSIVSGTVAGIKEWGRLGKELKQTDVEMALGYAFPKTREVTRRRFLGLFGPKQTVNVDSRRGEIMQFLDHTVLQDRNAALQTGIAADTTDSAKQLFQLVADSDARIRSSDRTHVNLFKTADGTPPAEYDVHSRTHDRLRAQARLKLRERYGTDAEFRTWIDSLTGTQNGSVDAAVDVMSGLQEQMITKGSINDRRYEAAFAGDLRLEKQESLEARTKAFNAWRMRRSINRGAQTAVAGGVAGLFVQEGIADITNKQLFTGELGKLLHLAPEAKTFGPGTVAAFVDGNHTVQLPKGLSLDASGNLVRLDEHNPSKVLETVVPNFRDHVTTHQNGTVMLDDYIKGEAAKHHLSFTTHSAVDLGKHVDAGAISGQAHEVTNGVYSGATRDLTIAGHTYTVPEELQVVANKDGTSDLVLKFDAVNGVTPESVHVASGLHVDAHGAITDAGALDQLKHSSWLSEIRHEAVPLHANAPEAIHGASGIVDADRVLQLPQITTPDSTHLVEVSPHHYNLVMDIGDGKTGVLLSGLNIDDHGKLLNPTDLDHQINAFNSSHDTLQLSRESLSHMVSVTSENPVSGTVDWHSKDWTGLKGGLWGRLDQNPALAVGDHKDTALNAVKNVWRGYEENWVKYGNVSNGDVQQAFNSLPHNPNAPHLLWYNALPSTVTFHDLPNGLFSDTAMGKIAHRAAELGAYHDAKQALGWSNARIIESFTDNPSAGTTAEVDKILWDAGVWGDEHAIKTLTEDRLRTLMAWAGGNETTTTQTELFNHVFTISSVSQDQFVGNSPVMNTVISAVSDVGPLVEPPVPYIPVPLTRQPLEATTTTTMPSTARIVPPGTPGPEPPPAPEPKPFYFGYSNNPYYQGLESWNRYTEWLRNINMLPPQIPPETTRDVVREQTRMRTYLQSRPAEEQAQTRLYAGMMKPMEAECRVAVTIPAYHEQAGIYHTLEEWAIQTDANGKPLDKKLYELDIIVNREQSKQPDGTLSEIQRFMTDHPDVRVNVIDVVFPDGEGGVGAARKLLADVTLQRSVDRGAAQTGALYMETEDADLLEIDRKSISRLITRFDAHPHLDALRGKQDLAPLVLKNHDYLFFERRVERVTELMLRDPRLRPEVNRNADSRWNTLVTGGWNTAFTAESYALIGGYQKSRIGEDVDIGSRISLLRGHKDEKGNIIPNTKVIGFVPNIGQSNPRRFIYALVTKKHAYHTFGDHAVDEAVHNSNPIDILNSVDYGRRVTMENKDMFEAVLNTNNQWLRDVVKDPVLEREMSDRLMYFMGFRQYKDVPQPDGTVKRVNFTGRTPAPESEGWKRDYHYETDGTIRIDNVDNIASGIEKYRVDTEGKTYRGTEGWTPKKTPATPDYIKEFTPDLPEEERVSQLEDIIPAEVRTDEEKQAWLAGHNKRAALETFIQQERAQLHAEGSTDWKNDEHWEKKWLSNLEMIRIADHYHIPMAFMVRDAHAIVLTAAPEPRPDGSFRVTYYDPFHDGEQSQIIKPKRNLGQTGATQDLIYFAGNFPDDIKYGLLDYEQVGREMQNAHYSLRMPEIPGKEWMTKAKMSLTQEDGHNCTLWSIFHAAVANAMQPGDNEFKREGLARLAEETGLRLITYEDAAKVKTPPAPTP